MVLVPPQLVGAVTALSAVVDLGLVVVASRRRETPAAAWFGLLALAAALWAGLEVAILFAPGPGAARLAYNGAMAVAYQVPVLWLGFTVVYTGHGEWLTRRRTAALCAPLAAYVLVRLTAPVHGLLATPLSMRTVGGVTAPAPEYDAALWVALAVAFGYVLAGFLVLARFYLDASNVFRGQTLAVIVAGLVPTVGTFLFSSGVSLHPVVSVAPALLAVTNLVLAHVLFRDDVLGVSPVAGEVLVDELPEPVFLLDEDDRILDYNPRGASLADGEDITGSEVGSVVGGLGNLDPSADTITVGTGEGSSASVYDVRVTTVEDQFGRVRARLVVLRDVSTQQRRLEQLQAMQAATQQFISARTAPEVVDIAVTFASDVLDHPYAVVFLYEEETDTLASSAMTDSLAEASDEDIVRIPRGSGPLWSVYESGETATLDDDRDVVVGTHRIPARSVLVLPLGDHGVLVIGSARDGSYSAVERQLGKILAGTIETALTRVAHERRLRESRTALERRTKQIEFFNGVLRHNIRNSMMVIDGHAQFLEGRVDGHADKLATIREWCEDMTELTEKIRDITDAVTASGDERLGRVDLSDVLDRNVEDLREECEDLTVEVDVDEEAVILANDLVSDILESILSNAVEHNDAERPHIAVSSRDLGEWVQVRVADNGPGIPDELETRVFQRDVATSQTSHGFGLYFVSVMMDLYDGNVWFEDNDPRGTVVVLEFRLAEDDRATPEE